VTESPSGMSNALRSANRWVRQVHFYASLSLGGLFLFHAFTGFLANRADRFDAQERPLQRSQGALPGEVALDAPSLAAWLSGRHPGTLLEKSVEADEEAIRFEMESVWGWHAVTVERKTRTYTIDTTPSTKIDALVYLHRGKWAGPWQRRLVDLTALALCAVTCTGIFLGIRHPVRSKRWAAMGLVVGSFLLVLFLCLNR